MAPSWITRVVIPCTPPPIAPKVAELVEREGVAPAPYLARASWVALRSPDSLRPGEVRALLREAYDLVLAKLPKKAREALAPARAARPSRAGRA